jgi:hypothetical protein
MNEKTVENGFINETKNKDFVLPEIEFAIGQKFISYNLFK